MPAREFRARTNGWGREARLAEQNVQARPITEHIMREAHALVTHANQVRRDQTTEHGLLAVFELHPRHAGQESVAFE